MLSKNNPPDESEQAHMERMLQESQARLAGIIDSAMDAIITVDEEQKIVLFNAAAEVMFAYPAGQVIGSSLDKLIPAKFRDVHRNHIQRFGSTGVTNRAMGKQRTLTGLKSNGHEFPVEASISQIQNADGKLYTVILRDVTERVKADELLREKEQNLRATFDQAAVGIAHIDPGGLILQANHRMSVITGYEPEELVARSIQELSSPVDWGKELALMAQVLSGQINTYTLEKQYIRKDRTSIWVNLTTSLVRDGNSNPRYFITIVEDISDRKIAESALRAHAEEIKSLNTQTQKQLHLLSALRTIDLAISASLDLRVTLNIVLDQVVAELAVDAASILLFDKYAQCLEFAAARGINSTLLEHNQILLGTGYAGTAAYEQKTIQVPDLSTPPQDPARADVFSREEFRSYAATPLVAKGEVKGVLEVYSRSLLLQDAEWLSFLEALAGQAAIAIDSAQLFDSLQRTNQQLILAYNATIEGWSRALDLRDKETEGHTQRVTEQTLIIAKLFNGHFSDEDLVQIRRGSLLHDIGKMGVPDSILLKPDQLTEEEWEVMHRHPEYAYQLLYPIVYLRKALEIPLYHHERWDGSGYPQGLRGEHIPLAARIFAVVDVWDALRSDRPYRPGWKEEQVFQHLRERSGTEFDPQVVEIFLETMSAK